MAWMDVLEGSHHLGSGVGRTAVHDDRLDIGNGWRGDPARDLSRVPLAIVHGYDHGNGLRGLKQERQMTGFRINDPDVVFEAFDEEIVVVNLDTGDYYSIT